MGGCPATRRGTKQRPKPAASLNGADKRRLGAPRARCHRSTASHPGKKTADRGVTIRRSRERSRLSRPPGPATWVGGLRASARHLVRVPRPVPGRPRNRRPQSAEGLRQRPARDRDRAAPARAVRAQSAAPRRRLALPGDAGLVDVLELRVHGARAGAALGLPAAQRGVHPLPQLDPAGERLRADRLRAAADRAAPDVPGLRLRRHARELRAAQPRQRPGRVRRQPVRRNAEPARRRRADRRAGARVRLPKQGREGAVAPLAGVGLVQRDGDRQPLLARLRGRHRGRADRGRDRLPRPVAPPPRRNDVPRAETLAWLKRGYTDGTRRLAARWIGGLARTRVTPNALTAGRITLCAASAVIIWFAYHRPWLLYWLAAAVFVVGSVLDILDGALARYGGKATAFGAFFDSTTDRVGEGAMLAAIGLVFTRAGNDIAVVFTIVAVAGSFLVPYVRAKAEALGLRGDVGLGSRAERVVVITAGLVFAPWGGLQWAIYLLAATSWLTVAQRILHVRKQLIHGGINVD